MRHNINQIMYGSFEAGHCLDLSHSESDTMFEVYLEFSLPFSSGDLSK